MRIAGWALPVAGGIAAAVVVARRCFLVVTVSGASMEPRYRDGDRILVSRLRRPTTGAVVVLRQPSDEPPDLDPAIAFRTVLMVKRVAALPGDPVPEAVGRAVGADRAGAGVPAGSIVVLGDAPDSIDSRAWGYLSLDQVAGVAIADLPAVRTPPESAHI